MKRTKTHAQIIAAALARTSILSLHGARQDILARLARIEAGQSAHVPLEVAGIERSLRSYLETELFTGGPLWRDVRALHAAWVAAKTWSEAAR